MQSYSFTVCVSAADVALKSNHSSCLLAQNYGPHLHLHALNMQFSFSRDKSALIIFEGNPLSMKILTCNLFSESVTVDTNKHSIK